MPSLWLAAALLAGLFQSLRTAMQQDMRVQLTVNGAGMVRHLFGLPFVVAAAVVYVAMRGESLDLPPPPFFKLAALTAVLQIFGTLALIHSFTDRGYLVGTAFSKTEAIQAAVAAALLQGEALGLLTWAGITIGVTGILIVALNGNGWTPQKFIAAVRQPAAIFGVSAAALLAATGLVGKEATHLLGSADAITCGLMTVATVMIFQCIFQGAWMLAWDRRGLRAVAREWRSSSRIGAVSAAGSICWFTAIAIAPVALVRIVGQAEVVFSMWLSRFYLKERPSGLEVLGSLLVGAGVALALLATVH